MPPAKRRTGTATTARRRQPATGLLRGRNAIVYGGGGGIGAGIARAFAAEGARVHLAGRTATTLDTVVAGIEAAGGAAEATVLDATDERAVDAFVDGVAATAGGVDVSLTVISYGDQPGRQLVDLPTAELTGSVVTALRANLVTARAAARHMTRQRRGAILTVTNGAATAVAPAMGGTGITAAAVETFTRYLAAEVGPAGIRVLGLRIAAVPETWPGVSSHDVTPVLGEDFVAPDASAGAIIEQLARTTMLHRLSTLDEVAAVAVFLASDRAGAMTGTVTNVTCGSVPD